MLGINPEVVQVLAAPGGEGDAVVGVEGREDLLLQGSAISRFLAGPWDPPRGAVGPGLRPLKGLLTFDVIEPGRDAVSGEENSHDSLTYFRTSAAVRYLRLRLR